MQELQPSDYVMIREAEPSSECPFNIGMIKSTISVCRKGFQWLWVHWYARKHVNADAILDTYFAQKVKFNKADKFTNRYGWQKISLSTVAAVLPISKGKGKRAKGMHHNITIPKSAQNFARGTMATMQAPLQCDYDGRSEESDEGDRSGDEGHRLSEEGKEAKEADSEEDSSGY
jgi:hypothetical protein